MPRKPKASSFSKKMQDCVLNPFESSKQFSLSIGALYKGRVVFAENFGKKFEFYDLASVTKAVFLSTYFVTRPELLKLRVSDFLPWLYKSKIKIYDLLNHQSGLPAHKDFFKKLIRSPLDERAVLLKKLLRDEVRNLKKQKFEVCYSDLGFMLLGFVVEEIEGQPLADVFEAENKISSFHFNPLNRPLHKKNSYAPTEQSQWRKKKIQGEVFDDNAFALGGVAPQAGLFGDLKGLLEYGKHLRALYKKNESHFRRANHEFAAGFMVPSGETSSAGKRFSKKSIGHLGYTGTSFWYDPIVDLYIAILSNRTFPDRENTAFNKYRPIIQDMIFEEFVK
jgi:CubicO group peptidase (beta-lactamase class C family)